ncbi:MAG: hypothetical protein AAGA99_24710 [Actinomycetota bacterium]
MSTSIRTKAAGAGMAVLLGVGGTVALATASSAQDEGVDDEPVEVTEVEAPDEDVDDIVEADDGDEVDLDGTHGGEDCDHDEADELDFDDLSDEEREEIEAEVQQLTAALDEAGISYELVDEDGIAFPEPTDEADWEAFEAVMVQLWAEEFAALPVEEQAEIIAVETAFADELKTALDEAGIQYDTEVDPVTGVEFPVFDDVDEELIDDVLDRVYDDGYGMLDDELEPDDEFELDDFDDEDELDFDDEDDEVEDDLAA